MKTLATYLGVALLLGAGHTVQAATLTVDIDADEANCKVNDGSLSACDVSANPQSYPLSTGCSLREALEDIADVGNAVTLSYPECGMPSGGGASNTIALGAHTINIYSAVPNPSDPTGVAMTNNPQMANIGNAATYGALTITGGTISCTYSTVPPVAGGNSLFVENSTANLSFTGTQFKSCTAPANGVIINSSAGGDLNLSGVVFGSLVPGEGIRAGNAGNGGCISHGSGNLAITGGSFTQCSVDDGKALPGSGAGNGGAIYIGKVGGQQKVAISGVTFQGNLAGNNGGAIYMSGTDAAAINTSNFAANIANGNTNSSSNAELGGGAIYASATALVGNDGTGGLNISAVLLFQDSFTGNLAPQGTGGAILLTGGGKISYGTFSLSVPFITAGPSTTIPGGIIGSNFSGNQAGGTWNGTPVDERAGSGGALYASGYVSILDSSFVGSNQSMNANGGAIAYYDGTDSFTPMSIANVTFNGNTAAKNGGAIANLKTVVSSNGQISLMNDTVSGNTASAAGGGGIFNVGAASDVNAKNTIFDSNTGLNCAPPLMLTDGAGNLQFNPTVGCGATITQINDPQLSPAAPFGGINALVFIMQFSGTSSASKNGNPANCSASPVLNLDAALNGRPQPAATNCDVGAFEANDSFPVRLQSFEVD